MNHIDPLRVMRDHVYGERSTDRNWSNSHDHWKADELWLTRQFNKLPKPLPPHSDLPWPKSGGEISLSR